MQTKEKENIFKSFKKKQKPTMGKKWNMIVSEVHSGVK